MNLAQQDKSYTESLLAQQLALWSSSKSEVNSASPAGAGSQNKPNTNEPPGIRQLRLQVRQYEETIKQSAREQKRLREEIKLRQDRTALSPAAEDQYKRLIEDYEKAQKSYQDLLAKKASPETAMDMGRQEVGERMTLLDPANLPDAPSFPSRPLFAGGGLAGGLVLGIGLALWLELRDKAVRTEQDVEEAFGTPVLVSLPWVGSTETGGNGNRSGNRNEDGGTEKKRSETIEV
jgi:succinoglycan biosynthesis transport protein ExoP